jgi:hypothetical protein
MPQREPTAGRSTRPISGLTKKKSTHPGSAGVSSHSKTTKPSTTAHPTRKPITLAGTQASALVSPPAPTQNIAPSFAQKASEPPSREFVTAGPIPRERIRAYQLGFLSLLIKILTAVAFGLLFVRETPMLVVNPSTITALSGLQSTGTPGTVVQSVSRTPISYAELATHAPAFALPYEPAGCLKPPDDYTRIFVNGSNLSQRTFAMLEQAAKLYHGPLDITDKDITKGGYLTPNRTAGTPPGPGDLSLGTHDGGGVVDLSVPDPTGKGFKQIEPLIRALRAAGFAAWFRDVNDGYAGNVHIHAVAIGDQDLSPEAKDQLTGIAGYFRGLNGLTGKYQQPDKHGGPTLCQWMIDAGYRDMRSLTAIAKETTPANDWTTTLRQVAEGYITDNPDQASLLAQQLGWTGNGNESADNMCGPLSAVILDKAGLFPVQAWPPDYLKEVFWLANPSVNGRPWIYFPQDQYTLQHITTRIDQYDFENSPLCPGDFIYTYTDTRYGGDEHMLVVSDVDVKGRAWSVTNTMVINPVTGKRVLSASHLPLFTISKVLLYDPGNPGTGVFRKDWVTNFESYYTGMAGFDIQRRNGACMTPGSLLSYTVRPEDTLPKIAAYLFSTIDEIVKKNGIADPIHLTPGQVLQIPVNLTLNSNSATPAR